MSNEQIATPGATRTGEDSVILWAESSRPRELLADLAVVRAAAQRINCDGVLEEGNEEFRQDMRALVDFAMLRAPDAVKAIEALQGLLRKVRWYVFHAECPQESDYDDQQAMLAKIDEAAPPPAPPTPVSKEPCDKEEGCIYHKGHGGGCDDMPF